MKELKTNLNLASTLGLMVVTLNHVDVLAIYEKLLVVFSIPILLGIGVSRI